MDELKAKLRIADEAIEHVSYHTESDHVQHLCTIISNLISDTYELITDIAEGRA
jgi:hypothetical protein